MTVDVLDRDGRSSAATRPRSRGAARPRLVHLGRPGRLDRIVEDGVYRPRVQLEDNGRTIVLPNPIRVDTTAPRITLVRVFPRVFSPDGDGRSDRVAARYEIDERARAMMLVDGRRRVQSKFRRPRAASSGSGGSTAGRCRPGTYEIRLRAFDRAGNRSSARGRRPRRRPLRRALARPDRGRRRPALLRSRLDRCAQRTAGSSPGTRGIARSAGARAARARRAGVYTLYVTVGGRADSAESSCRAAARGRRVTAPLFLLGVSRSGTTLLRVILDRSPGHRDPRRVVLRPAARAAPSQDGIDAGASSTTCRADPDARGLGLSVADDIAAALRPGMATATRSPRSSRRTRTQAGSRAGATRPRCTCATLPLLERALPGRAVRPPDPRRPRRGALVPARCPRGRSRGPGRIRDSPARVRLPVAERGRRARALGRRVGPSALPGGALRGARRRSGGGRAARSARSRRSRSSRRCSTTPAPSTCPRSRTSSACSGLRPTGVRDWRSEMDREDVARVRGGRGRPPRRARLRARVGADTARRTPRPRSRAWYRRAPRAPGTPPRRLLQRSPLWRRRHPRLQR